MPEVVAPLGVVGRAIDIAYLVLFAVFALVVWPVLAWQNRRNRRLKSRPIAEVQGCQPWVPEHVPAAQGQSEKEGREEAGHETSEELEMMGLRLQAQVGPHGWASPWSMSHRAAGWSHPGWEHA